MAGNRKAASRTGWRGPSPALRSPKLLGSGIRTAGFEQSSARIVWPAGATPL